MVIPLPKQGKATDVPGNLRPISLLSNVGKLAEKVIHKKNSHISYPDIPSSKSTVPHPDTLSAPQFLSALSEPAKLEPCADDLEDDPDVIMSEDTTYNDTDVTPHFPNQEELTDLIRDLGLTKFNAEF